jgi:preprotein translocase subunit SecD
MRRGTLTLLFFIILLGLGASYVVFWPNTPSGHKPPLGIQNPFTIKEGLDLQGGVEVLLAPDPSKHYTSSEVNNAMPELIQRITDRVNGGLGVNEPDIREVSTGTGLPGIAIELPGLNSGDPFQQIQSILKTGDLQFWDTGPGNLLTAGTTFDPTQYSQYNPGDKPLFTGADLDPSQLSVSPDQNGGNYYQINFAMKGPAIGKFSTFTANHIGDALTIVLDGQVVSSATIQSQIPGNGEITGQFTLQQATDIVNVLKYGALPIVMTIQSEQIVGATLGQDSIVKSEIAGAIGLGIVILFMLLYYRLPGLLADLALLLYATFTFAIFKLIGVVLTLAGIAGFVLSIGMAVDANVLIFERVKEELREGRLLASAIDIGWKRAWPSIRDSNISTMITCAVLYFFGSNFGASIIVGFATTLFLGVVISMFTAVVVTRTFLNLLVPTGVINHPALFGLPADAVATASVARRGSTV